MRVSTGSLGRARLAVALIVSALFLTMALFLFFFFGSPGQPGLEDEDAPAGDAATNTAGKATPQAAAGAGLAGAKDKERAAKPAPEEEIGEPLLRGRVRGEGQGIPGARVRLFSMRRVEQSLDRFRALEPPSGDLPDLKAIVVTVFEELEGLRRSAAEAVADSTGVYRFRRVEEGSHLVLTVADGWVFRFPDVVNLAAGRTETLDVDLNRGLSIAGRVVGANGEGLAGVTVTAEISLTAKPGMGALMARALALVNGEFLRGPFQAVTRADGAFTIDSLPPGLYDLAATRARSEGPRLLAVEGGMRDALLYWGKPADVVARFTDTAGRPAGGIPCRVESQDDLLQLPLPLMGFADVANSFSRLLVNRDRTVPIAENGELRVTALPAGRYRLSVEERGFLPFNRTIDVEWDQDLDLGTLRIDRGEAVTGVVQLEGGRPLAGAKVLATPAQASFFNMGSVMGDVFSGRATAITGEGGEFRLAGLGRGKFHLSASCRGYSSATKKDVAPGSEPVVLVLKPGTRIEGEVVESREKTPIAGARVECRGVRAETDAAGRFALEGVVVAQPDFLTIFGGSIGPGRVEPGPEPANVVSIEAAARGYLGAQTSFNLEEAGRAELVIALKKAPLITGRVLDPDGKPVMGSLARLVPGAKGDSSEGFPGFDMVGEGLMFLSATVTDEEGKFRFSGLKSLDEDKHYRVIADHVQFARGSSETFSPAEKLGDKLGENLAEKPGEKSDSDTGIEVRLSRPAAVNGTVTDGRAPVAGAAVRLLKAKPKKGNDRDMQAMMASMWGLPKGGDIAYTDREGKFRYERLEPGSYELSAEKAGLSESKPVLVTLEPGDTPEVELVVDPGGEISGAIANAAGEPLGGARVRLLKEKGGQGADDRLVETQKMFGGSYRTASSSPEGTFALSGLPAGRYALIVELPGYTAAELGDLSPGGAPQRIVLQPAASLEGRVVDAASGRPITQFLLHLRKSEDHAPAPGMDAFFQREHSDPDGAFLREDLAPGLYTISVTATGCSPLTRQLQLASGRLARETFPLAQAGRVRGWVLEQATQRPVGGARISLAGLGRSSTKRENPSKKKDDAEEAKAANEEDAEAVMSEFEHVWRGLQTATSGEDGSFLLEGVPNGLQTLVATHPEFVPQRLEQVEILAGQERELEFTLRRGLSLSGRVLGPGGEPVPGKTIFSRGSGEANAHCRGSATSGPDGAFRMGGLEPGPYRVFMPENLAVSPEGTQLTKNEPLMIEVREDVSGIEIRLPQETRKE